ncbi:hypothetical protein [Teredinibacter purpureus]|uniref:hypothetical protein n=1 Tax=Teredinibacter purpureus TaxID=2731756 RepID=UPI0006980220|nr:hypothetical protein [Teredinibacter purpureus]
MKALPALQCVTALCLLLISELSQAHVRWFVEAEGVIPVDFKLNGSFYFSLGLIALYILAVTITHKFIQNRLPSLLSSWNFNYHFHWYSLFSALIALLICNLMIGEYLAPNLTLPPHLIMLGILLQAAVIVLLPISVTIVGVALCVVAFLNMFLFKAFIALDYFFEFMGVGLAFVFIGPSVSVVDKHIFERLFRRINREKAALCCLRIGLGLQLIELAIHNKFIGTGYALLFVEQHSYYNFIQAVGFNNFTHTDFVYFVGLFETLFGLLLCLNFAPRLVRMTLATIFIITSIVSGVTDLVGHLPILGVLLILILEGEAPERTHATRLKQGRTTRIFNRMLFSMGGEQKV